MLAVHFVKVTVLFNMSQIKILSLFTLSSFFLNKFTINIINKIRLYSRGNLNSDLI